MLSQLIEPSWLFSHLFLVACLPKNSLSEFCVSFWYIHMVCALNLIAPPLLEADSSVRAV
jgi:hypothetical protein